MIKIELLTKENFHSESLNDFIRTQKGEQIYKKVDGKYEIINETYTMDWSLDKKRDVANDLMSENYISYIALKEDKVVGFIGLYKELVEDKMIMDLIQVSNEYRRLGIGKRLFETGVEIAKKYNAKELYMSAFPGIETVAFYQAMGVMITKNPIRQIEEDEPDDVQMTYII